MISYSLFLEYVKDNILSYMPQEYRGYEANISRDCKENNQVFEGIYLKKHENSISCAPILYCEDFYKIYQQEQDIDSIMRLIAWEYVKIDSKRYVESIPNLYSFEEVKDKIGYDVVNEKNSYEMLVGVAHKTEGELAKVYRVFTFDEDEWGSIKIPNSLLESWNVSIEQLDEIANQNMPQMFPPIVISTLTALEIIFDRGEELPAGINVEPGDYMYVLTNLRLRGGASAIFYPDLLGTVRQQLQEDFYILPASTEEVYICPKTQFTLETMQEQLRKGNREFTAPNQFLSNCIYEYTEEAGRIRRFPEPEQKIKKKRGMER